MIWIKIITYSTENIDWWAWEIIQIIEQREVFLRLGLYATVVCLVFGVISEEVLTSGTVIKVICIIFL